MVSYQVVTYPKRNRMTSGEENWQRNRNREGEESECLSVFFVLYVCLIGRNGGDQGRRVTSVKSDGRESTCNMASTEARSCFHRP